MPVVKTKDGKRWLVMTETQLQALKEKYQDMDQIEPTTKAEAPKLAQIVAKLIPDEPAIRRIPMELLMVTITTIGVGMVTALLLTPTIVTAILLVKMLV